MVESVPLRKPGYAGMAAAPTKKPTAASRDGLYEDTSPLTA
jgi:hypothetical protein